MLHAIDKIDLPLFVVRSSPFVSSKNCSLSLSGEFDFILSMYFALSLSFPLLGVRLFLAPKDSIENVGGESGETFHFPTTDRCVPLLFPYLATNECSMQHILM